MNELTYSFHIFTCFFMTGLIWTVQLVHYPAYRFIDATLFKTYQRFHQTTITFIVGPIMIIEVFSGLHIVFLEDLSTRSVINFSGLIVIWLSTLFFSIPIHGKLGSGGNKKTIDFLVNSNWIRTIAWTLRSGLWIYILLRYLKTTSL